MWIGINMEIRIRIPDRYQNNANLQHWMNQSLLNVPFKMNVKGGNFVT
jgi:hypothetical protein